MVNRQNPILYIVIPCYNEQEVLPVTSGMFLEKIRNLKERYQIHEDSKVVFVNDGSKDNTWNIICNLAKEHPESINQYLSLAELIEADLANRGRMLPFEI